MNSIHAEIRFKIVIFSRNQTIRNEKLKKSEVPGMMGVLRRRETGTGLQKSDDLSGEG